MAVPGPVGEAERRLLVSDTVLRDASAAERRTSAAVAVAAFYEVAGPSDEAGTFRTGAGRR